MTTLNNLNNISGGGSVGGWARAFPVSGSHTFTVDGTITVTAFGGAGSGATTTNTTSGRATGGNSPPWGRKTINVIAGDVLTITVAAGGASQGSVSSNGLPGGNTVISLNGTPIMTCQGAEGGVYAASGSGATPAAASAVVTGADYWVPGVRSGSTSDAAGATSGGAALDILNTGLGRSPNVTGPAGNGGSVATDAGGPTLPYMVYFEFGVAAGDGMATLSPGRGGVDGTGTRDGGPFAGGCGSSTSNVAGNGGMGGGGGARTGANSGAGGRGYAFVVFTPRS